MLDYRDILAELARWQVEKRELARAMGVHPTRMSPVLDGTIEVSENYVKRCIEAIKKISSEREKANGSPQETAA